MKNGTADTVHASGRSVERTAGRRQPRRAAVLGLLTAAAVPVVAQLLLSNAYITAAIALGCFWLVVCTMSPVTPEWHLGANSTYLPIFVTYSLIGLSSSGLRHTGTLLFCLVASACAFGLGWWVSTPSRRIVDRSRPIPQPSRSVTQFRFGYVWVILAVTVAIYAYCVALAGGVPALSDNSNLARTQFYPSGYVAMFVVMGIHVLSFVGIVTMVMDKQNRFSGFFFWFAATCLALGSSNRGVIFIPVLLAIFYLAFRLRVSLLRLIPLMTLGLGVFAYLGYRRSSTSNGQYSYSQYLRSMGYEGSAQFIAPMMSYVESTMKTFDTTISYFPQVHEFAYGTQFFSPLLLKQSVDLWIKDVFSADFQGFGLALGSMNALYIDWGLPGVVVGSFMFAVTAGYVFSRAIRTGNLRWIVLYAYVLMHLILSVYGHPFAYLYYVIEPVVLWAITRPHAPGSSVTGKLPLVAKEAEVGEQ